MIKNSEQKFKYLKNENKVKLKAFFITFKGLSAARNRLRPLIINTPERYCWGCYADIIVNFEQISHIVLVIALLILNS